MLPHVQRMPFAIVNNCMGTGSYGSVEEVWECFNCRTDLQVVYNFYFQVNGIICAGKRIHDILIDAANAGVESVADKYVQECQLMPDLSRTGTNSPFVIEFLAFFNTA